MRSWNGGWRDSRGDQAPIRLAGVLTAGRDCELLLTAAELRAALETLGKSQGDLMRELSVRPETVNRWATGKVPVPGTAAAYLNLLLNKGE